MSEAFRARLRRLRREPTASERSEAGPGGDPGDSARSAGAPHGLDVAETPEGAVSAREERFDGAERHGAWRLDEIRGVDARAFALLTGDSALAGLDPTRAVYLDTETTGLSGGAGTYVFLIGLGRFEGDRFHLWQGFLRDPAGERALLAEAARRIAGAGALVSFFGKAFDRHRLEDKMRIAGVPPPFAGRPHLDLHAPFRRLTKGRLPDGRLATLESALCGLARGDDLPGALAPAAWFDWLAGRAHDLEGVFRHNRLDVLSLVTLAAYLGRVLGEARTDGAPLEGCPAARAAAIAKSHLALGSPADALPWLELAIARAPSAARPELSLLCADVLRVLRRVEAARTAFTELTARPSDAVTCAAWLGLAKIHEHADRDLSAALAAVHRARATLPPDASPRLARDVHSRLLRLARRCGADFE